MSETSFSQYNTPYLVTINSSFLGGEKVPDVLSEYLKKPIAKENIIFINEDNSSITIDMVRALITEMSYAAFQGKIRHVVLLNVDQTTHEAQNAVLKLLEEPPTLTQFWLFTQYPQSLLPTIVSRCFEVTIEIPESVTVTQELPDLEFMDHLATVSHRELIEVAEKYPDRAAAQTLVDQMIIRLHQRLSTEPSSKLTAAIATLLTTKQHLTANVSPKLALEHSLFSLKKLLS